MSRLFGQVTLGVTKNYTFTATTIRPPNVTATAVNTVTHQQAESPMSEFGRLLDQFVARQATGGRFGLAATGGGFGLADPFATGYGAADPYAGGYGAADLYTGGYGAPDPYAGGFGAPDPYAGGYGAPDPYAGGYGRAAPYAADPYASDPWGSAFGADPFGPPQTGFGMMMNPYGGRQTSGFGGMMDPYGGFGSSAMGGGMGMFGPLFGGGGGAGAGGVGGGSSIPPRKPCRNPIFLRKCNCAHQCGHDSMYYGQCEDFRESSFYAKFCCPVMVHFMCEAFE